MYEKFNYLTTVKPETKDKAEKELSKEEHLPAQLNHFYLAEELLSLLWYDHHTLRWSYRFRFPPKPRILNNDVSVTMKR
ncbi:hypothetical protein OUZ56_019609 [Daphnia magna]|uniref:Uncharacterized protein n=1 Tax=Daphnia magna TaxID=35525 RepID=A0ABQ9ZC43_9CRUS|nr:hypothetical protein OUZ56_019609 [Daphnia magna]